MTPEGRVKDRLKKRLRSAFKDAFIFMPVQNGMGVPGLDFFCCIYGMFVAIETKRPGGELTERQQETSRQIVAAGGLVFKVSCDEEIERVITTINHIQMINNVERYERDCQPRAS